MAGTLRVLVIEDREDARQLLCEMLARCARPLEVVSAADGFEGLRVFRLHPCDIVITDIYMPEQGGLETIGELRRILPEVKIIAISGGGGVHEAQDALLAARRAGVRVTLKKPFSREMLAEALEAVLREDVG